MFEILLHTFLRFILLLEKVYFYCCIVFLKVTCLSGGISWRVNYFCGVNCAFQSAVFYISQHVHSHLDEAHHIYMSIAIVHKIHELWLKIVFFSYLPKIAGSYNEADKYQEVFHMLRNLHRSCKGKGSFLTYELYQRILYYYLFLKIFNIFF